MARTNKSKARDSEKSESDGAGRSWLHLWVTRFLQLTLVGGLALAIYERHFQNVALIGAILLLMAVPRYFSKKFDVHVPPDFELAAILFVYASVYLGETRDYYGRFWWWDIALHTTSGGLLGIFGVLLVYLLNEDPRVDVHLRPGFMGFFAFCFAVAMGALWEIFEFAMDRLVGTTMQKPMLGDPSGLTDTMWDLIVDSLGALVVSLIGYLFMRLGQQSFVTRGIDRFVERNPQLFRH